MKSKNKKILAVVLVLIIIIVGIFIRIWTICDQIILGDEWHSVHIATSASLSQIFNDFFSGSHSTPIALYYNILLANNVFNESTIYIPFFVSGILLFIMAPWMVRNYFDVKTTILFMVLLALAPILVFYSRYARPYGIITLLSFISLMACYFWWTGKGMKYGYFYAVTAVLATYFHVISFPFVIAPLIWVSVLTFVGSDFQSSIKLIRKRMAGPLLTMALLFFVLYRWQLEGIILASKYRVGQAEFGQGNLLSGFRTLISGSDHTVYFVVSLILLIWSLIFSWRRKSIRHLFGFLLFPVVVQLIFIIISKPLAAEGPHIFARYLLMTLPVFFLIISFSMSEMIKWVAGKNKVVQEFVFLMVIMLVAMNFPFKEFLDTPANSRNTVFLAQMIHGRNYKEEVYRSYLSNTMEFYDDYIKKKTNNTYIIETPFNISFYAISTAQFLHGKKVLIGYWNHQAMDKTPEYPFSNVFALSLLKQSIDIFDRDAYDPNAEYVIVFHKHMNSEDLVHNCLYDQNMKDYLSCIKNRFGKPVFEDDFVAMFLYP